MPKRPDLVVLGMHADDTLNVYLRDPEGDELHQAARIMTHNGVKPLELTSVMANLADVFDWHQIVAAPPEVPHTPSALPRARTAAAVRVEERELPRGISHGHTRAIYQRIMKALDEAYPAPMRFGELHGVVGRGKSSGQVFGYLSGLVKRDLVVKPGEGLYLAARQGALPVEPVDSASHPAGKAKRSALAGRNFKHHVTIEDIIEYVAQHPEGVRQPQIAEALLPGDEQSRHTISNRLIAYRTRCARTGEAPRLRVESDGKVATVYPVAAPESDEQASPQ
jgi:hypothetical protein